MKLYTYQEYKEKVLHVLRQEYGTDVVEEIVVHKENLQKEEGIFLRVRGNGLSPIIYFNSSKEWYVEEDVQKMICSARKMFEEVCCLSGEEIKELLAWENVKEKIVPKLVNYELNKKLLERTPHMRFYDLAIMFFYPVDWFHDIGQGVICVKEHMKAYWGVDNCMLMKHAMSNLRKQKCTLVKLEEVMEMYGAEVNTSLYLLTVYDGVYGAAAILNKEFMRNASEKMGSSKIWIIPSSLNEVLLLPYQYKEEADSLQRICAEVNQTLEQEDILSDTIYLYDNAAEQIIVAKEAKCNG